MNGVSNALFCSCFHTKDSSFRCIYLVCMCYAVHCCGISNVVSTLVTHSGGSPSFIMLVGCIVSYVERVFIVGTALGGKSPFVG